MFEQFTRWWQLIIQIFILSGAAMVFVKSKKKWKVIVAVLIILLSLPLWLLPHMLMPQPTFNGTNNVVIYDNSLKKAIYAELNINDEKSLTAEDLVKLKRLECQSQGITST